MKRFVYITGKLLASSLLVFLLVVLTTLPVLAVAPSVTTSPATSIINTAATLNGNITAIGVDAPDYRGFVWDTTSRANPGNTDPSVSAYSEYWEELGAFGIGLFDHNIIGLVPLTTYYFRAFAHNTDGWAYGDELDFFVLESGKVYTGVETVFSQETVRAQGVPTGLDIGQVFFGFSLPVWSSPAQVNEELHWQVVVPEWWDGDSDIVIRINTATLGDESGNTYELQVEHNHSSPNIVEAFPAVGDYTEVKIRNVESALTYAHYMDVFVVPWDFHPADPIVAGDVIGFRVRHVNTNQQNNIVEIGVINDVVVYFARGDMLGEEAAMAVALLLMVQVMALAVLGVIATLFTIAMFWKREPIAGWVGVVFWFLFGGANFVLSTAVWDAYYFVGFASMFIGLLMGAASFQYYKGSRKGREDSDFIDKDDGSQYIGESKGEANRENRSENDDSMSDDMPRDSEIGEPSKPSARTRELRERSAKRKTGFFRKKNPWGEFK